MLRFLRTKWLKVTVLAVVGVLVAIQFIPYNISNPSTQDEPHWNSPQTRSLFVAACANCHSNQTKVLWFEHVAPVKWYISSHVEDGRRALNISQWHSSAGNVHDIAQVIRHDSMPPSYYTYFGLHSESKLTAAEKTELIGGMAATAAADPPAHGHGR